MFDEPILITGCARSGTSMTAGIVHKSGAWGGNLVGSTKYNPKGFYENGPLRQDLIKPFLRQIGADPLGQKPLPRMDRVTKAAARMNWHGKVQMMIRKQGYRGGPWYYKGAKMCLIWPMLDKAFPKAKWIIVRRDTDQIVDSCLRTSFMRKCGGREGWTKWVNTHLERFLEMEQAMLNIRYVWPSKFIHGDFQEAQEAIEWAGLKWDQEQITDFIDPALWNKGRK